MYRNQKGRGGGKENKINACFLHVLQELVRLEEQELDNKYEIGVIYCKPGQETEKGNVQQWWVWHCGCGLT